MLTNDQFTLELNNEERDLLLDMFRNVAELGVYDDTDFEQDDCPDLHNRLWGRLTLIRPLDKVAQ